MSNSELEHAYAIDKAKVRLAFDRAAETYDEYAALQAEIGERMLSRLDYIRIDPKCLIDIGCGTGRITKNLAQRFAKTNVIALDLAEGMLRKSRTTQKQGIGRFFGRGQHCRVQHLCADAEDLPLSNDSIDFVFSSVTFQWCTDLDKALQECYRVLTPGSLILFSSFGPDTLSELRSAWKKVDDYNHVNAFIDMHDIGDALIRAGFQSPVLDIENFTLTYNSVKDLMRELKAIGAHNVTAGRQRSLMGKQQLRQIEQGYEKYRDNGKLPASYEVIYGHAWVPEQKNRIKEDNIEVKISLKQLRNL
ncbi:malonyl-ACP O-methyltransferase BioC [Gammaproteobacteria bacterium AH-315-C21]|nr:malonyl-ACP O-methyltransferase BioC [Gammaproteobacteria bacterium AH-315-C21]